MTPHNKHDDSTYLRDLYEETILDHNRNPRNFGAGPTDANRHARGFNPICNDAFDIRLRIKDGLIEEVCFEGAGCAISTASASMMTEAVKGKTEQEARALFDAVHRLLIDADAGTGLGKLAVLSGVHEYPMRIKCATLPWHTLRAALERNSGTVSTEPEQYDACPTSDTD